MKETSAIYVFTIYFILISIFFPPNMIRLLLYIFGWFLKFNYGITILF